MKEIYTEFNVNKEIPGGVFDIPTDVDSFLELLGESTRSNEKMRWTIEPWGIEFYIGEIKIGTIEFYEKEKINVKETETLA